MTERRATYRVQLNAGFGFTEVSEQVDYFAQLGVSHVYCSPCLQAAPGSTHGYDVVDHGRVNQELGGAEGHAMFCDVLQRQGLHQLLDIVPNHMAVGGANPAWADVLENGPSSRFAAYFDVDWAPPEERLREKILLPILGDHYGKVLEAQQVRVVRNGGAFVIRYFEHTIPVSPRSLAEPLSQAAGRCGSDELAFISDALEALPLPNDTSRDSLERRHRDRRVIREYLERLTWNDSKVALTIDQVLEEMNGDVDLLDAFLAKQNTRLAYWRSASRDLGYRRFFDINTLVALRAEDHQVFVETHALPIEWLNSGKLDGVRVDHPDGLRDPQTYFRRLRHTCPDAWVVVEKILENHEALRDDWAVQGTTGYDFLNVAAGLFVWPAAELDLTRSYETFTGDTQPFAERVLDCKRAVLSELLGSDVNRLTALFVAICEQNRRYRDFTRHDVHEVLKEAVSSLSVYRTYVRLTDTEVQVSEEDRAEINAAIGRAKQRRTDLDGKLFDFLQQILLGEHRSGFGDELAARFQQLSGPVMAKAVEDTAFYQYVRFAALNEVGGEPQRFGTDRATFHEFCRRIQSRWPETLLATSSHDTKRSEDVRSRLWVLSEIPQQWAEAVLRWSTLLEKYRRSNHPDRGIEYLFYQTVVGAWPIDEGRIIAYLEKAACEAKTFTSWTQRDSLYEAALREFVHSALSDGEFLRDLRVLVETVVEPGRLNSLAYTLLKLTAPGVPDIYQGTEVWDLSLVDPDNRRPVDYRLRRQLLHELECCTAQHCMARSNEGLPKLWLIHHVLQLRKRRPDAFGPNSSYTSFEGQGTYAECLVAYFRGRDILVIAPRWNIRRGAEWQDTHIDVPEGNWSNCLTGETVHGGPRRISELTAAFPVVVLERNEVAS